MVHFLTKYASAAITACYHIVSTTASSALTSVPTGDCVADAGFSAVITASKIDPFFSIDGATGAGVENTVAYTGTQPRGVPTVSR